MPLRRRFRRRVNSRKSKRRTIKRYLRRKSKQGNLTAVKLRLTNTLSSDAGGTITQYYNFRDPSSTNDWSNFSALYDSYRVFALKIKFVPLYPNNLSATTTYMPLYWCVDQDNVDNTGITSVGNIVQYENLKVKNMYKPWKIYIKCPKWLQASLPGGFQDIANPVSNGVLVSYGSGFNASSDWGTMIVTYYVGFKNRR